MRTRLTTTGTDPAKIWYRYNGANSVVQISKLNKFDASKIVLFF